MTGAPQPAIVTGASSGIGRASALALAARGHDLGATFQSDHAAAERLADEARALGVRCVVSHLDLAEPATVGPVLDDLADELGGLGILVNNAGANRRASTFDETVEGFDWTLAVNLVGPWAAAKAAAARMVAAGVGGSIVNVTSILAFEPLGAGGAYGAAKAGLEALTRTMALELAEHGIRVNAVAPGHTATPMNYPAATISASPPARPVIPLGRAAHADEIAEAVVFLATGGSYVTGASLLVDGGLSLASGPEALQQHTGLPPERTA